MNTEKDLTIGQKIKELRVRKGYSQEVMADLLEMTTNGYAKIEQDKTPNLSIKRLEQIAEVLDSNIFELLSLGEKNTYYIGTQTGGNSGFHYTIHQNFPKEYQRIESENIFLKEKIVLLEDKIKNLEQILKLTETKG